MSGDKVDDDDVDEDEDELCVGKSVDGEATVGGSPGPRDPAGRPAAPASGARGGVAAPSTGEDRTGDVLIASAASTASAAAAASAATKNGRLGGHERLATEDAGVMACCHRFTNQRCCLNNWILFDGALKQSVWQAGSENEREGRKLVSRK